MKDQDIARRLQGFEDVWKRVGAAKPAAGAEVQGLRLMPGKQRNPAGRRHNPRQP